MRIDIDELEQVIQNDGSEDVEAANYLRQVVDEIRELRKIVNLLSKWKSSYPDYDEVKLFEAIDKYLEKNNDAI